MAFSPKLTGRKKRRMVLTYDRAYKGRVLQTRVDLTLDSNNGEVIGTPISQLYQERLTPFFNVPKRPNALNLRQLTICLTNGGQRTVYMPYLPIDSNHNAMIQEYINILDDVTFNGLTYNGEGFIL